MNQLIGNQMTKFVSTLYSIVTEKKGLLYLPSTDFAQVKVLFKPLCRSFTTVPALRINHERELAKLPSYGFIFSDNFVKKVFEDDWIILDNKTLRKYSSSVKATASVWMLKLNLYSARKMMSIGQHNISFLKNLPLHLLSSDFKKELESHSGNQF